MIAYLAVSVAALLILGTVLLSFRLLRVDAPEHRILGLVAALIAPIALFTLPTHMILQACRTLLADAAGILVTLGEGQVFQVLLLSGLLCATLRVTVSLVCQKQFLKRCGPVPAAHRLRVERLYESIGRRFGRALPPLLCSPGGTNAWTVGCFRPRLVLGEGLLDLLDDEELQGVMAHELAHVVRRDNCKKWATLILTSLTFFLPTSWVIPHLLRQEWEKASDDRAVRTTQDPFPFAEAIAKIWQQPPQQAAARSSFVGRRRLLEQRIRRLIEPASSGSPPRRWILVATPLLVGMLAFGLSLEWLAHGLP
ncbi:MAG: M56 family metallopeptidase, partial [Dehalococcoidia bacterium]